MTFNPNKTTADPAAAIVGTGFIGPVHVEGLRRAGIRITGILGSSAEKSKTAARELNLPRGYRDYGELLDDPAVSVVHITTPNRYHHEQATAALKAGKHVLCEKPLAMNSRETGELVRLARERQLVAGVAYNIRFYPLCHHASALFRRGDCGRLLHVQGSYTQDWLLKPTDFNWRVLSESGGDLRAVADIGTHWLDLIQFVTGSPVTSVFADLGTVHQQRFPPAGNRETFSASPSGQESSQGVSIDTEDCGSVLLRFANGAKGVMWVSQVTAGRKNCLRFEIGGSDQALGWNSEVPNELWIGQRDAANRQLIRDPALLDPAGARVTSYPGGHNEGFPDTFKQLFRSFYGYLVDGDLDAVPPFPTFADGHREVRLCEAILASHRQQCWIEVEEE